MSNWALIQTGQIKRFLEAAAKPADIAGHTWLPVERTEPAIDAETEELEGPTLTVLADKVTDVWTRRAKTAIELDSAKEAWLARIFGRDDRALLRLLFNVHNRVRALEGQPVHTAAQFRALVKGLL